MAKRKVPADLDLLFNELQNVVAQNLSTTPATSKAGQFWFDTVDDTLKCKTANGGVKDALSQGKTYTQSTGVIVNNTNNTIGIDTSVVAQKTDLPTKVSDLTNDSGFITGITGTDVTTALGYTPYNATNPSGYQANVIEGIKVNGTAKTPVNKVIELDIPVDADDVGALPDSTKYAASIAVSLNTTDYKLTITLKDQDGNTLGTAQVVDFPIESVVVGGSYDSTNKKIVLTLQNGTTIDVPVGDLISGLQAEITAENPLDADLVDDSTSSHKFVTAANKTTWNNKQDAISDLATIRSGAAKGATSAQKLTGTNPALTVSSGVCTWTISNTLATEDVIVSVKEAATGTEVYPEITTSANSVIIKMNASANITAGTYKAVIIG